MSTKALERLIRAFGATPADEPDPLKYYDGTPLRDEVRATYEEAKVELKALRELDDAKLETETLRARLAKWETELVSERREAANAARDAALEDAATTLERVGAGRVNAELIRALKRGG